MKNNENYFKNSENSISKILPNAILIEILKFVDLKTLIHKVFLYFFLIFLFIFL
jgi:hypothetical protein